MPREHFPNVCASDKGRWIAGGFRGRPHDSVAFWEARSGRLVFEQPLGQRLTAVALDTATRTLAAECLGDNLQTSVVLFDVRTGQRRATVKPQSVTYAGVSPCFTPEGRLLIQTKTQLEWWEPHTGQFLRKRIAPQSCCGFLLSTQACGRFRIIEYSNTDPDLGINPEETYFGLEVLSDTEGSLQGALLKKQQNLLRYATHPATEIVALMVREGNGLRVQIYQAATQRLLAERTFGETMDDALRFSYDSDLLYVGGFRPRAWQWRNNSVRHTRPHEVRDFTTFFLGEREVYIQSEGGAICDARTDRFVVRLASH